MRRPGGFATIVAGVLLVAGCGGRSTHPPTGGQAGGTTTVPSSASVPSTTPAPTTTDPALAAKAVAALFQPADFPAAFKAQPDQGGDCPASSDTCASLNLEPLWSELTSCLGVADNPQARATSPTYKENLATQARVTVEYTTVSSAAAIATALAGPKFQACANSAFTADAKRSAPQGATPGPVSIAPLSGPLIASLAGQTVSASRVNVTMNLGNLPIMINQDFLVIFKGGAIIRMFFLNPGGPFPPSLEQSLVQKVATRAGT